jgi:hypothetical protein
MDNDTLFNGFSILVNLIILGFNLKLYTEYFKDKKISQRKELKGSGIL